MLNIVVVVVVSLLSIQAGLSDLNVAETKECGQLTCGYAEFCNAIDGTCRHCSKICNEGHNQEVLLCNQHCQDYIHEMRFMKKGERLVDYSGDREQIHRLQVLSTVSLIVSLLVFACLVFLVIILWLNKKTQFNVFRLASQMRKRRAKSREIASLNQVGNGDVISTIRIPDDKLPRLHDLNEVIHNRPRTPQVDYSTLTTTFKNYHARSEPDSTSSVCTAKSSKVTQPLAVRLPSEDSTLDFMYDNPALAPSPTLDKEPEKVVVASAAAVAAAVPGKTVGHDT